MNSFTYKGMSSSTEHASGEIIAIDMTGPHISITYGQAKKEDQQPSCIAVSKAALSTMGRVAQNMMGVPTVADHGAAISFGEPTSKTGFASTVVLAARPDHLKKIVAASISAAP